MSAAPEPLIGNSGWATMKQHGQLWEFLGNTGDFQSFFRIRASKCLGNHDGQHWRNLGNSAWATMKQHGQLWEFLGNTGDFQSFFKIRA